jgi:cardiolipin synthase
VNKARREPRYTRKDLTLANAFTTLRLILIPIFGYLWWVGENERALWVFCVAAITDVLDGFLARYLNQRSQLGALLDPIADKVLMLVSLIVGVHLRVMPIWFAACVIGRDSLLLIGAVLFATRWKAHHGPASWRPTRIGKYAMFLQTASVVLAILDSTLAAAPAGLRAYVEVVMIIAALMTIIAWAQYGLRAARAVSRGPVSTNPA